MPASFPSVLAAEIAAVQRFVGLLKQEQEVLSAGKLDELAALTEAKGKLVDELGAIGQQRQSCLAELGVAENRDSIEDWLGTLPNPKVLVAWRALQTLAREAKALNELNGQCIALLSRNNRQLLDAITGQQARGTIYGPDGQTTLGSSSRISDSV